MKIVFMGTPDYAARALEAVIAAGHEVMAVVTQPDKPKGRSGQMQFSPVKECAVKYHLPVLQPVKIREPESVSALKAYEADIYVVAAFGQILTKELLEFPKLGSINLHASLLPKYRGASPIQWCIINGEKETGVTIMQMDEGIDTGDILTTTVVPIVEKETAETLFDKLSEAGAQLLVNTLPKLAAGEIVPKPQDNSLSTHTKIIKKSLGKIDWTKDAVAIERLVRGLNSWPSAYTFYQGKSVKLWNCDVVTSDCSNERPAGTIIRIAKDSIDVSCGKGILRILELQLEGKKRMDTKSFLLGNQWKEGSCFGEA